MSTLDEISEDWQINGLPPTWAKLQKAKQEQAALVAENKRLVDEVNEARQEISEQARVCGMGAEREARLMARINTLERTLTHIHGVALADDSRDLPGIAKDAKVALEKKHEAAT